MTAGARALTTCFGKLMSVMRGAQPPAPTMIGESVLLLGLDALLDRGGERLGQRGARFAFRP